VLGVDIQASTNLRFRESGRWALNGGVVLEKRLDDSRLRARAPYSLQQPEVSPFSIPSGPSKTTSTPSSPSHPVPHPHCSPKKNGHRLRCRRRLQIRGRSCAFKVVGYASLQWMGKSIEHLVVGVGVLIVRCRRHKLVGSKSGGGYGRR